MSTLSRTDHTDRQLQRLPQWAQDVALRHALDAMRASEFGTQASFQDALENTLDIVFADTYVFARIGAFKGIMPAEDVSSLFGRPTQGTLVVETQHTATEYEQRLLVY